MAAGVSALRVTAFCRSAMAGLSLLLLAAAPTALQAREKPVVVGWIEHAVLSSSRLPFLAKLDTGARTTSISAQDIQRFRKNGASWVRFTARNREGATATFERPVDRVDQEAAREVPGYPGLRMRPA